MTIEDAVEDYLIYAYFELDHPRRCYVGKTLQSRAEQRDQEHRSGESGAKKFNAFVKNEIIYGDRDFDDVLDYKILEQFTGTAKECAEREGEHIQRKNSIENGWNLKAEGTGTGLLFPSTPPGEHKNRPQIRRSRTNIQVDLSDEIIQDAIEYGLEQSILERDKEYRFQELKTLIAKSFVAHANQSLNLTVQEPAPDEIKSVLNDWTKLENSWDKNIRFPDPMKWWGKQLEKSGFERPLNWKIIPNIIRSHCGTVHSSSPIVQWLKGNPISLDINLPRLDKKWGCYGGSADVWQVIRFKFLAKFPNTLQKIEEKEEAARIEQERQERERLQREREAQERLRKEKEERERQERIRREKEERKEQERLQRKKEEREEKERQEQIQREREEEAARIQREKEERERKEREERIRKKREEAARLQREREEQKRLRKERKKQERIKGKKKNRSGQWAHRA